MSQSAPLPSSPQRAIQEAATPKLAQRAAGRWGAIDDVPMALHSVQNFVYAIELPAQPAILRLTHESHRASEEIGAELDWMFDLITRRLPVAPPLRSLGGKLVETLDSAHGRFFATCFERLSGIAPDPKNPALWSEKMFEQLGATMARLHQASVDADWTDKKLARRSWRDESAVRNFHSYVPIAETSVHRAFDRVLAQLDSLPRARESYGLIHADLNHANFFITPNELNIFDFDDSCYSWFAYDLIVPIFHFPTLDQPEMDAGARSALNSLLLGYERVRPFDPAWLEWLPLFLKWRDLITYGFFYEQLEIAALPPKLRQTFDGMRNRIEADRPIADLGPAR